MKTARLIASFERFSFAAFVLLVGSCKPSRCDDLARDAWAIIEDVGEQHRQCSVDADCTAVPIPSGCWSMVSCTYRFVGNAELGPALARAASGAAGDLCRRFDSRSCSYAAPSCPSTPVEQEAWHCLQGKCAVRTAHGADAGE